MATPFLGEIMMVAFNFAPKGFALCNGQLLPINQNQALFSLLSNTYGGDGRVNFGLPNMGGRIPMHVGAGYTQGLRVGEEKHTLTVGEVIGHGHQVTGKITLPLASAGTTGNPAGAYPAPDGSPRFSAVRDEQMANVDASSLAGPILTNAVASSNSPFDNRMPYLPIYFVIALQGVFPSRT
jgi:microcystin-dependent protein